MKNCSGYLDSVATTVEGKLREVSTRTLEKLQEMSPDIASTLNPVIPTASSLKWADVFKSVSITSDENIPINKRGSGSKRLILLNFFRAEVERRQGEVNAAMLWLAIITWKATGTGLFHIAMLIANYAIHSTGSKESNVNCWRHLHGAVLLSATEHSPYDSFHHRRYSAS